MSIINNYTYDVLKLNYILFSKFKQRVYYKVARSQKINDRITWSIIESGYINPDSTKERIVDDFDGGGLNSATAYKDEYNEKFILLFDLAITRNNNNDYQIESKLKFEKNFAEGNKSITETSLITNKKKTIPFESDELYFVIIYPNNAIPALVRVYDKYDFNVLNIDDKDAIYNSYLENVDLTKNREEVITKNDEFSDVKLQKIEDDDSINDFVRILSHEEFDKGVYYNKELGIVVGENSDIIIGGANFSKAFRLINPGLEVVLAKSMINSLSSVAQEVIKDKFNEDALHLIDEPMPKNEEIDFENTDIEVIEKLKSMVEEIYPIKLKTATCRRYKNNYWIYTEQEIVHFNAIITNNIALVVTGHIYLSPNEGYNTYNIASLNLENEEILTNFKYVVAVGSRGENQDGLRFYCRFDKAFDMSLFADLNNPLDIINNFQNMIVNENILHYACNGILFGNLVEGLNKTPFNDLLTIKEDDGEYFLVRGPLGNLVKKKIN